MTTIDYIGRGGLTKVLKSDLIIIRMAKRMPNGHGPSFGSWPWQKECLKVMADSSDLGNGKKGA